MNGGKRGVKSAFRLARYPNGTWGFVRDGRIVIASPLSMAILASGGARGKPQRVAAARDVARLSAAGARIGELERLALGALFDGTIKPKEGAPRDGHAAVQRTLFRAEFERFFHVRKSLGMNFEEAIEQFAEMKHVKEGTAREWVSTRKNSR